MDNRLFHKQEMEKFLTRNESRMTTDDFFRFLEENQDEEFIVRPLWVTDEMGIAYQYRVCFGGHFMVRANQRMEYFGRDAQIDAVMKVLHNMAVARVATSHPVYWDEKSFTYGNDEETKVVAVISDNETFIPFFVSGDSFIYVTTVYRKSLSVSFRKEAAVIQVDAAGNVFPIK